MLGLFKHFWKLQNVLFQVTQGDRQCPCLLRRIVWKTKMYGRQEGVVGTLMSPRVGRQNNCRSIASKSEKCFSAAKASTPVLGSTQFRILCFQPAFSPGVKRSGCEFDSLTPYSADGKREWSCNLQPSICLHSVRKNKFTFVVAAYVFIRHGFRRCGTSLRGIGV
jgi:hypothetical protein